MNRRFLASSVVFLSLLAPQLALAAAGGGGLPWEGPLATIQASMTGPVAVSVALIAIMVSGGMLIFGGEINNFARTGVYITLVLGLLVMAQNVLSGLYATGAAIPEEFAISSSVEQQTKG